MEECADISGIMRDHLPAVMQLLTNALPEYSMSLRTTKCLNTAIMTMYLVLGQAALRTTAQCDVDTVRNRRGNVQMDDTRIAKALRQRLLRPGEAAGRELHYVMLTDGDMPLDERHHVGGSPNGPNGPKNTYFPGHVFVIERTTSVQLETSFRLFQSYINKYDVAQHMARRGGSADVSRAYLTTVLDGLVDMSARPTWTAACTRFWKHFTLVDAAEFEGYVRKGVILMCHRSVTVDACARSLRDLVHRALADLASDSTAIWGDSSLYDKTPSPHRTVPLTVGEMGAQLVQLKTKLSGLGFRILGV